MSSERAMSGMDVHSDRCVALFATCVCGCRGCSARGGRGDASATGDKGPFTRGATDVTGVCAGARAGLMPFCEGTLTGPSAALDGAIGPSLKSDPPFFFRKFSSCSNALLQFVSWKCRTVEREEEMM